jgi:hypothetical protein
MTKKDLLEAIEDMPMDSEIIFDIADNIYESTDVWYNLYDDKITFTVC